MEGSDSKTDDGDSKDKKDDDEDMSLDQNNLLNTVVSLKCQSHASLGCLPVLTLIHVCVLYVQSYAIKKLTRGDIKKEMFIANKNTAEGI